MTLIVWCADPLAPLESLWGGCPRRFFFTCRSTVWPMVYTPSLKDSTAITCGAVVSMTISLFTVRLPSSPEDGSVVFASCSSVRCGAGMKMG